MDNGQLTVIGGIAEIFSDGIFFKVWRKLMPLQKFLEAKLNRFTEIAHQRRILIDGEGL